MSPQTQQARVYTLHSPDKRVQVTVHASRPAYVYVTHHGLTEGEVDAALMKMAAQIPSPCWVIVLPTFSESQGELKVHASEKSKG